MFLDDPSFKIAGDYEFVLDSRLRYMSKRFGFFEVESGFITDFASIPRFFRRIIAVNGPHRLAAVLHDYLYFKKGKVNGHPQLSRGTCDRIFFEAMKTLKVPMWQRHAMYRAVRLGGWVYWNSKGSK